MFANALHPGKRVRRAVGALVVPLALAGLSAPSFAAILVPVDYSSVGAALLHAYAGDSVLVACGTYLESGLVLRPGVTLLSEAGDPSCVTIEGGYEGSIITCANGTEVARLGGLTLAHGGWLEQLSQRGGGINARNCSIEIRNCQFEEDFGGDKGGAIYAEGATLEIMASEFHANQGTGALDGGGEGGAIACYLSTLGIEGCLFFDNCADHNLGGSGGAIFANRSAVDIVDSEFVGNWTYGVAGAIYALNSASVHADGTLFMENRGGYFASCIGGGGSLDMVGCLVVTAASNISSISEIHMGPSETLLVSQSTFVALGTPYDSAILSGGVDPQIINSLFIVTEGMKAYGWASAVPSFECCNIYSSAGDAWVDSYADQFGVNGNIEADPQFCGIPGSGNYYLQSDSPCAPANNSCGELIGALPVNCDTVTTQETSMSAIKSLY